MTQIGSHVNIFMVLSFDITTNHEIFEITNEIYHDIIFKQSNSKFTNNLFFSDMDIAQPQTK